MILNGMSNFKVGAGTAIDQISKCSYLVLPTHSMTFSLRIKEPGNTVDRII